MQIAQIHESETGVRWQHAEDIKACENCQKALKSSKDKVGIILINLEKKNYYLLQKNAMPEDVDMQT